MTRFNQKLAVIKNEIQNAFPNREWEMEQYMTDAITYANKVGTTLDEKMEIIEDFVYEQMQATEPEWMN